RVTIRPTRLSTCNSSISTQIVSPALTPSIDMGPVAGLTHRVSSRSPAWSGRVMVPVRQSCVSTMNDSPWLTFATASCPESSAYFGSAREIVFIQSSLVKWNHASVAVGHGRTRDVDGMQDRCELGRATHHVRKVGLH